MKLNREQRALVFKKLRERKAEAAVKGQIDNATLSAGSPMYYYCQLCGLLADTMPEGWFISPPNKFCEACARLFSEYELTMEEIQEELKCK